MSTPKNYQDNFYQTHLQGAVSSAENVIPVVKEYIAPASVIDVGCGVGAWLSVWEKSGVKKIVGVDGAYIDKKELLIKEENFRECNLEKGYQGDEKYDLVCCLEVAEHLPQKSAETFVASLCALGDIVLFSAAIPGQQGTMHINEQYPDYWAKLFAAKGFIPVDCIRLKIWNNPKVEWWYRQNILLFVKESQLANYPLLTNASKQVGREARTLIHPELQKNLNNKISAYERELNEYVRLLKSPGMTLKHAIKTIFNSKK